MLGRRKRDVYLSLRWVLRGEYLIGINEFGREVALIKLYTEPPLLPDASSKEIQLGRVKTKT